MGTTIIMEPDVQQKLAILGEEASDEVTDALAPSANAQSFKHATGMIYPSTQQGGGSTRLFKVLQTNACRYACQ